MLYLTTVPVNIFSPIVKKLFVKKLIKSLLVNFGSSSELTDLQVKKGQTDILDINCFAVLLYPGAPSLVFRVKDFRELQNYLSVFRTHRFAG